MPFLQFKGKSAVETYHHSLPHYTLELDATVSVTAPHEPLSLEGNLIIEGDNLLALKALLPTHAGRIKCIYIDPPYNTGAEGWVYNDNLTQPQFKEWIGQTVGKEGEDAARHDKWCCMMYPRLQLLNALLCEDGIIFISIDGNEVHNLRALMNETFGEDNFIADFVWESRLNKDNRNISGVSVDHEYVVCYGKKVRGAERDTSQYSNPDNDIRGPWSSGNMVGLLSEEKRPNLHYELTDPETGIVYAKPTMGWRYDEDTMSRLIAEKRILWPDDSTGRPRRKVFLHELDQFTGFSSVIGKNLYTRDGTREVEEIFGRRVIEFPKPMELIEELIEQGTEQDSIVLDSFAGSGTTAQAVLNLNRTDSGNRKFVLIQQPYEPKKHDSHQVNICRTITAERVRRLMLGYDYVGVQSETLFEQKVGLNTLKKADELLKRIETAKKIGQAKFDEVQTEMKDGIVRVTGKNKVTERAAGWGGSFTYARVSERPMFGDYREFSEPLPVYEELAKYVFYTETSREWNPMGLNRETGKIGEHNGVSYYLLYHSEPGSDWGLDLDFLNRVVVSDPNRTIVLYHEKFLMHREQLKLWEAGNGKKVRSMQVPFQLR